jgi:hypothetical protein
MPLPFVPGKLIIAEDFNSDNACHVPAIVDVGRADRLVCERAIGHSGTQDAAARACLYKHEERMRPVKPGKASIRGKSRDCAQWSMRWKYGDVDASQVDEDSNRTNQT